MKFKLKNYSFYLEINLDYRAKFFSKCKKLYIEKISYNIPAELYFKQKQSISFFPPQARDGCLDLISSV